MSLDGNDVVDPPCSRERRRTWAKILVAPVSAILLMALFENGAVAWGALADASGARAELVPGSQAGPSDDGVEPSAEEALADSKLVGPDEVADPDAEATAALVGVLGDRFSGTWVDHETGRRQVAMVDRGAADGQRVRWVVGQESFDLVEVGRSLAELEELKAAAVKLAKDAGVGYMIGVNQMENVVDGGIQAESWKDDGMAPLRRLVEGSRGALDLELGQINPMYPNTGVGGVRMWIGLPGGPSPCSTGFGVSNAYGEFMTGAGHCSYGQTGFNVYNATSDSLTCCTAGLAGIVNLSHPDIDVLGVLRPTEPQIWNGAVNTWIVGGSNPQMNEPVCYRGASAGVQQCGTISKVNYAVSYEDAYGLGADYSYSAFCMSGTQANPMVPVGGDSGSAVYQYTGQQIDGVPTVRVKGLFVAGFEKVNGVHSLLCGPTLSQVLSVTAGQLLVK